MTTTVFRNARFADGTVGDVAVDAGRVTALSPAGQRVPSGGGSGVATEIDLGQALLLPGLIDGHAHLDKTLLGRPWLPHQAGPARESRIETEKRLRGTFSGSIVERAAALLLRSVAYGTRALRTHVDVDPEIELRGLHALLEVRERYAHLCEVQIVAFPQSGIVRAPGTEALLDAALREGADLVGGIDPIGLDGELDRHLDAVFGLAERHGKGVDLHLHDAGADGLAEIAAVVERTAGLAMAGRVTVSHGFALGAAPAPERDRLAQQMAEAGVSLATHGAGAAPLPPLLALRAQGVEIFAGNDNVRDTWGPYGDGDMLERAMLIAWRSGFRTDPELALAFELASRAGAAPLGLPAGRGTQLAIGEPADFFCVRAENVAEAVVSRPARTLVVKRGRVVARGGEMV